MAISWAKWYTPIEWRWTGGVQFFPSSCEISAQQHRGKVKLTACAHRPGGPLCKYALGQLRGVLEKGGRRRHFWGVIFLTGVGTKMGHQSHRLSPCFGGMGHQSHRLSPCFGGIWAKYYLFLQYIWGKHYFLCIFLSVAVGNGEVTKIIKMHGNGTDGRKCDRNITKYEHISVKNSGERRKCFIFVDFAASLQKFHEIARCPV